MELEVKHENRHFSHSTYNLAYIICVKEGLILLGLKRKNNLRLQFFSNEESGETSKELSKKFKMYSNSKNFVKSSSLRKLH